MQDDAQPTEPHRSGPLVDSLCALTWDQAYWDDAPLIIFVPYSEITHRARYICSSVYDLDESPVNFGLICRCSSS